MLIYQIILSEKLRVISIYQSSYLGQRLRGIKRKKSHRGSGMNILFLFYYSPKPRN